jgi:DNA-binding NtrC family response regulator
MRVADIWLRQGSLIRVGRTALRFELETEANRMAVSPSTEFGSLVGASLAMRATFSLLERAATTDSTVLLEGETGTGKEGAAESIHRASSRNSGPFLVVDCGAIPANLLESELFGHERGAFTGATSRRIGVFEEAAGGSVFLDEIGELAPDLQPKLLRVLERREIRRIGTNASIPVDVRVIAATNRDLRAEVNAGRFRSDLYFRLAVLRVTLPALRQRPEDLPLLVERIVEMLGHDRARAAALLTPALLADLRRNAWPGNVRELRNFIERCLVFEEAAQVGAAPPEEEAPAAVDPATPYAEARRVAIDAFERSYVKALIAYHRDNVGQAARASGMNRAYLYRLLQRHGLTR